MVELSWREDAPAFYFLSAEFVLHECKATSLPRMQELRDNGRLTRIEIPLADAFRGDGIIRQVLFVSHRSETEKAGVQLRAIRKHLETHPTIKWVWFEYAANMGFESSHKRCLPCLLLSLGNLLESQLFVYPPSLNRSRANPS